MKKKSRRSGMKFESWCQNPHECYAANKHKEIESALTAFPLSALQCHLLGEHSRLSGAEIHWNCIITVMVQKNESKYVLFSQSK